MKKIKTIIIYLIFFALYCLQAEDTAFLGKNYFAGIKFSSWQKNGSGTIKVIPKMYFGNEVMELTGLKKGEGMNVYSPFISIQPDNYYFVSVVYKSKNFGEKGYSGVSAGPRIIWYDENKKDISHKETLWRFQYFDNGWDFVDGIYYCPPNAKYIRVEISFANHSPYKNGPVLDPTLLLSGVQFRRYTPPPTPEWAKGKAVLMVDGGIDANEFKSYYFASRDMRGTSWSKKIIDKDAERGTALTMPVVKKDGIAAHGNYERDWDFGLYRAQIRLRRPPSPKDEPLGYMDILSEHDDGRLVLHFTTKNVPPTGKYITLERDFIVRGPGFNCIRLFSSGKLPWTVDWCRIIPLKSFSDSEFEAIYPGITGSVPDNLKPVNDWSFNVKVLIFNGFGYDNWRFMEGIRLSSLNYKADIAWAKITNPYFIDIPANPKEIFNYDVVALLNADVRNLSMEWRKHIYEYVKRGGGLFVTGGNMSFERSGWRGSLLEPLLPFTISDSIQSGLKFIPEGVPVGKKQDNLGYTTLIHKVKVKDNAKTVLNAGNMPFAVEMKYGKGKVLFITGWACGTLSDPSRKMFYDTKEWPYFIRNKIWWLWGRHQ